MADQCYTAPHSSWVRYVCLRNDKLGIEFKNGVYCEYPNAGPAMWQMAVAWASKGGFVHEFLFKKLPYRIVGSPCKDILGMVASPCCANPVRKRLTATVEPSTCPGVGNFGVDLDWDAASSSWKGRKAFGATGRDILLTLQCTGMTADDFQLAIAFSDGCGSVSGGPVIGEAHCDPFSIVYQLSMGVDACDCDATNTFRVTITE